MRSKSSMRLLAQVCLAPRRYGCAHRGSSIGGRTRVRDGFSLVDRASCGASTSCRMGRSTNAAHWRNISSRGGDGVLSFCGREEPKEKGQKEVEGGRMARVAPWCGGGAEQGRAAASSWREAGRRRGDRMVRGLPPWHAVVDRGKPVPTPPTCRGDRMSF